MHKNPDRPARQPKRVVDGILLLDKPTGCTSNAALQQVKRLYRAAKAGHTGSLDPLATGMLPICFGQATKLSPWLLDADKTYRVTLVPGARTDTGDADGTVVERCAVTTLPRDRLEPVLARFVGELEQVPPMYSAIKQDGRRLYQLARAGIEVAREVRRISIRSLEIEVDDPARPVLRVRCSKGTYVRTLVEDIARAAGSLAHVGALRRLSVEPFPEAAMVGMERLLALAGAGEAALDAILLPPAEALPHWPSLRLNAADSFYLRQGQAVRPGHTSARAGLVRLCDTAGRFLGVGEVEPDGRVIPRRLFV